MSLTHTKKPRLRRYVAGVLTVWAIVLGVSWLVGGPARFHVLALVCAGFLLGMLAMYIAVHLYVWQ
jgi:hypothetical protein